VVNREQREEKQGSMQKAVDPRQASWGDREWWTSIDEGYWQALLTQGEIAPEAFLLRAPRGLRIWSRVPGQFFSELSAKERPEVVLAFAPGAEDGWKVAQHALDQARCSACAWREWNRGGLLVDWNGVQGFVQLPISRRCLGARAPTNEWKN